MLTFSEQFTEVAKAILSVQRKVSGVTKDAKADAGKKQYRYATLDATIEAIREACCDAGLIMMQAPCLEVSTSWTEDRENVRWENNQKVVEIRPVTVCLLSVETRLVHAESGQWVSGTSACGVVAGDAQAVGSGQTYMRRYGLMSLCGLAPEDEDGQAARGAPTGQPVPRQAPQTPAPANAAANKAALVQRVLVLCEQTGTAKPKDLSIWDEAKLTTFGRGLREQLDKQTPVPPVGPGFHE